MEWTKTIHIPIDYLRNVAINLKFEIWKYYQGALHMLFIVKSRWFVIAYAKTQRWHTSFIKQFNLCYDFSSVARTCSVITSLSSFWLNIHLKTLSIQKSFVVYNRFKNGFAIAWWLWYNPWQHWTSRDENGVVLSPIEDIVFSFFFTEKPNEGLP